MTARIEVEKADGGMRINRLITNDANIIVPATYQDLPVVSLGPQFLRDSHGSGGRTLIIPASVTKVSDEALVSMSGLRSISYLGNFETFNTFRWSLNTDCQVTCGDGFTFNFLAGYTMSFPDFDDEILTSHQRISEELVMARLTNPLYLTDDNRVRYEQYMRSRIVPMAEHAMIENDVNALKSIVGSDLLSVEDLFGLLENSVRSGKTMMTSVLMSILNQIYSKTEQSPENR